jgi:hypothetical protein
MASHCELQLDPIVRRVHQILARSKVVLGCLNTRVPEQHLDLL